MRDEYQSEYDNLEVIQCEYRRKGRIEAGVQRGIRQKGSGARAKLASNDLIERLG